MPIKTVRAHSDIVRREGLGAQQCVECGTVYDIDRIPEFCSQDGCNQSILKMESYLRNQKYLFRYHLSEADGQAIQKILKVYSTHLHSRKARAEGDYVWQLAKLFDLKEE